MTDEAVETVIPEESDRATIIDLRVRLREAEEREEQRDRWARGLEQRFDAMKERAERAEATLRAWDDMPAKVADLTEMLNDAEAENERLRAGLQLLSRMPWPTARSIARQALGEEAKT